MGTVETARQQRAEGVASESDVAMQHGLLYKESHEPVMNRPKHMWLARSQCVSHVHESFLGICWVSAPDGRTSIVRGSCPNRWSNHQLVLQERRRKLTRVCDVATKLAPFYKCFQRWKEPMIYNCWKMSSFYTTKRQYNCHAPQYWTKSATNIIFSLIFLTFIFIFLLYPFIWPIWEN